MSDEEKKKAEEAAAEALASEQKKKAEEGGIDYAAELEKARKQLGQAEHVIETLKKKPKEKIDNEDDDKSPQFDPEEIYKRAAEIAQETVEKAQSGFIKDYVEDAIASASNDPAERELIRLHYENSIKKSGFSRTSILEDIQKSKVLANKPRLEKMEKELAKAGLSKITTSKGAAGGFETEHPVELSPEEEKWIQQTAVATGKTVEQVRAKLLANRSK